MNISVFVNKIFIIIYNWQDSMHITKKYTQKQNNAYNNKINFDITYFLFH